MTKTIWTVRDIIQWSISYLKKCGSETPRLDVELLLCHALSCRRIDLYINFDKPLVTSEREVYRELIRRRSTGEPIAYILGVREFYGLEFKVNKHVLIPRPDTELLVESVLQFCESNQKYRGLDLGTGSGCIAIAIKKHRPNAEIEAWDDSSQAIEVAIENAKVIDVDVYWKNLDILNKKNWTGLREKFEFIVSNPPYISESEKESIQKSVLEFEPSSALFASDGGLKFYSFYAHNLAGALKEGGKIFLEVGYQQASVIIEILKESGWHDIVLRQDLNGRDRVIIAKRP